MIDLAQATTVVCIIAAVVVTPNRLWWRWLLFAAALYAIGTVALLLHSPVWLMHMIYWLFGVSCASAFGGFVALMIETVKQRRS